MFLLFDQGKTSIIIGSKIEFHSVCLTSQTLNFGSLSYKAVKTCGESCNATRPACLHCLVRKATTFLSLLRWPE